MKIGRSALIFVIMCMFMFQGVSAQDSEHMYTIGMLSWVDAEFFISEMTELGYIEGENINYMIISYDEYNPEDPAAFADIYNAQVQAMIDAPVDVFVTNTDTDILGLLPLTTDIPMVFSRSDDPVATGVVESLVHPGGIATGTITNRPHERRLQILTEVNPQTDKIYYLYSPVTLEAEVVLAQVRAVAADLDIEVVTAQVPDLPTALEALENTPEGVDWLFLTPYIPLDQAFFDGMIDVSLERKLGIAYVLDSPIQGHVVSYGPSLDATARQAAHIVDLILRGANPGDLPVQTAENFLTINLEAAEAIGLEIPVSALRQANTIVRPGYFDDTNVGG